MQRINYLLVLIGSVEDKVINMFNHLEQEIKGNQDYYGIVFKI